MADNLDFANYRPASIQGIKFEDRNGDGQRGLDEPALAGWTIYLDANNNGALDWADANGNGLWEPGEGERWTLTADDDPATPELDETGLYRFENLRPGRYWVREVVRPGWQQTTPQMTHEIMLVSGQTDFGADFGNRLVNRPPTVDLGPDRLIDEGTELAVTGTFTDPDADTWTATVDYGDGSGLQPLPLAPDKSFQLNHVYADNGVFTVTVTVTDNHGANGAAALQVTVANKPPIARDDAFVIGEDTTLTVQTPGVLANDGDVAADPLTAQLATGPTHGNVTLNANGAFVYVPNPDFNGTDSFAYQVADDDGATATATVTVTVTPVNDPPVAQDVAVTTNEDTPVSGTLTATDVDGDSLTYAPTTAASKGALVVNANGSFTYTPDPNVYGTDTIEFEVDDGKGGTSKGTLTVTINPVNDPPVAQDVGVTTNEDTPVSGTLKATDVDGDSLTYAPTTAASKGALVVNANGSFTYTP
ncbi:MAG: tandem-95 repeat protein, partial [Planctomycetes bacterium]|nr:tandem-95 repeat protein [Planctomycetota bacterium]